MAEVTTVFKVDKGMDERIKEGLVKLGLIHAPGTDFKLCPEACMGLWDDDRTEICQPYMGVIRPSNWTKNALITVTLVNVYSEDDDEGDDEETHEFVCVTFDYGVAERYKIVNLVRSLGVSNFPEADDCHPSFYRDLLVNVAKLRVFYRQCPESVA